MKTLLDKITDSKFYSTKRYYLVVFISCMFVTTMFVASIGGVSPSPSGMTVDYPEGMSSTSPFSEQAFRNHSLTLPVQSLNYSISHGYQIDSRQIGIIESNQKQYRYSADTSRLLFVEETVQDRQKNVTKIYETESSTYESTNGTVSTTELDESILENPTKKSVEMVSNIEHIKWSSDGTIKKDETTYIKYTPSYVDTSDIPNLETAKTVSGQLLVNQETGVITEYSVEVQGSSSISVTDTIRATYFYQFNPDSEPVEEPTWVNST